MRGKTGRLKVVVSMFMLMALFVFGAVFMIACESGCAHENMEHHAAVSATCTQTGNSEYWTCPDCDKIFADEGGTEELSAIPEIAKTAHDWDTAYRNDENGHWHKCRNCDATSASEPHTVAAIGEEKPATCTEDGVTAGEKCSVCGYVTEEQKTLSKLEHKLTHFNAKEANCSSVGNIEYWYCERCEGYFTDEAANQKVEQADIVIAIDPSAHKFGEMQAGVAATCTATGVKAHKDCEYCKKHFAEDGTEITDLTIAIDPSAHKFGEMQAEVAATCTTAGTKAHKDCEYCKKHFDESGAEIADLTIDIDPSAHKFGEMQSAVAATCTTAGTKAHKDCEYCGKHFDTDGTEIADLTIAALGHSYAAITVAQRPEKLTYFVGENFDESGMKVTATCTRGNCGEVVSVTDYTLSGNISLEKGAKTVTVTWGEETLTVNVSVSVYEKHDLLQEGSYADFVYAASGDLTATAKQSFSCENGKLLYNGTAYEVFFSGASLTLKEATVKGLLGEKTYGDFAVTLITDSFDQYEMNIAIVTNVIDSADDLTAITQANKGTALVDGYYIVTADFDAAEAGIKMTGSAGGNTWSAKAVSFASIDSISFDDANQYYDVGFKGIFDGRGHTIANLNTFAYKYRGTGGLFGQLLDGSVVRNIAFTDVTVNGRYGAVLVGETCAFDGLLENVVITIKSANLTNTTDTVKILWMLTGGEIRNCLFVGVDTVGFGVGDTDAFNVMYVAEAGKFDNSGTTKYDDQLGYTSVNAMFAALKEENVLSDWNCGITYADGAISFNGKEIVKPAIVVSYECENNEITRGTSVTFTTDGYVQITLKGSVEGVSIQENILTVAGTVAENAEITVLVTSTLNASVTQEITFKVIRAYTAEIIAETLDFSLEDENSAAAVTIDGTVERIVAGSVAVTEGITYQSETLTLTKAALNTLLNGKAYVEGLTVNIYTSADKNYTATVNIATMLIDSADDLTAITQANTAATIDAYYIVTKNIDASTAGVTVNCTGNGQTYQNVVRFVNNDDVDSSTAGFSGIFDGRGHIISNITSYAYGYNALGGLFGQLLEGSVVKNIAFTEVTAVGRYGTILVGESQDFGGALENVVITVKDINLSGSGAHTCAYIVANLAGGTLENCLFVGVGTISTGGSSGSAANVMSVATTRQDQGGFHWTGVETFTKQTVYASVEAMFTALQTENLLQDWGDITYLEGAIFFNGEKVLENITT